MKLNTGHQVAFQLADVICPDFDQIMAQLGPDLAVAGEVTLLSDRGDDADHFAVVQVSGVHVPLIVPVGKLTAASTGEKADIATQS